MAKTIKFSLICDGVPIRTLEELQENFSIEDILKYYANGLLETWLKVRGFNDALAEIKAIESVDKKDKKEIIVNLIKIFGISIDEEEIRKSVYMLQFLEDENKRRSEYISSANSLQCIIEDYHEGYECLVRKILENPKDGTRIKISIDELVSKYKWVLDRDYHNLFWKLYKKSPLAIMRLLMNEKTRPYYLPSLPETKTKCLYDKIENYDLEHLTVSLKEDPLKLNLGYAFASPFSKLKDEGNDFSHPIEPFKRNDMEYVFCENYPMYRAIQELISEKSEKDWINIFGEENISKYENEESKDWVEVRKKGTKCMIIKLSERCYVREAGREDEVFLYSSVSIKNFFSLFDGLEMKNSTLSNAKVWFMEV